MEKTTLNRAWLADYVKQTPSDISEHLLFLYDTCIELGARRVLELGVRTGHSTRAFLLALKATGGRLTSVDLGTHLDFPDELFAPLARERWQLILGNSRHAEVPEQELDALFVDTGHTFNLTTVELGRFAQWVRTGGVILLHDTIPQNPQIQVREAIEAYAAGSPGAWQVSYREMCNGLGIMRRV